MFRIINTFVSNCKFNFRRQFLFSIEYNGGISVFFPLHIFPLAKMSMDKEFRVGNRTNENQIGEYEVVCCQSPISQMHVYVVVKC